MTGQTPTNERPQAAGDRKLGEALVTAGRLAEEDLERVLRMPRGDDECLGPLLARLGLVSELDVAETLAAQHDLPLARAEDYPPLPVLEGQLALRFLKHHQVVPLAASDEEVRVAVADPADGFVLHAIRLSTGRRVSCRIGLPSEIQAALARLYGAGKTEMAQIVADIPASEEAASEEEIARLKDMASGEPIIRLVNLIIQHAVEAGASDIHVEPFEGRLKLRYRIDGMLQEVEAPPESLYPAIISRLKIMAKMNIAERRLPQDARIRAEIAGREIDIRVSTVPTLHGESMALRLLYKDEALLDLRALGFDEENLERFRSVLNRPYGILLVTGPTGSGKTTTLYAALRTINDPSRKILTVEDPVEYQLPGVNQIQVKPQIGLTFANALRSIVRQDPDVIMIGEMRDLETAEIAVQSALTGHLVLSTLHTNDAASSVTRLLDMGIAGYLVTSVVYGVLAQRLVRKLCPHCRESYQALPELTKQIGLAAGADATLYRATGCDECRGTGYHGRVALMEMLLMSDRIRKLVLRQADVREIADAALAEGMQTMYQDGLRKALAGVTSIEEVFRVTREG